MKREIVTELCPKAIGPYSQGIVMDNTVFTVQIPFTKDGKLVSEDIKEQMVQCMENIKNVLAAADCKMNNVVMRYQNYQQTLKLRLK